MIGLISHWIYNVLGIVSPFILIPYLIKNLGVEAYGSIALVQIISFATLPIVDFGLSSVGPKWMPQMNKRGLDGTAIQVIYSSHFLAWLVSSLVGSCYIIGVESKLLNYFLISQLAVLASVLPPMYLLVQRGMQLEYGFLGILNRIIHIIATLILVKDQNDIWIFFLSQAALSLMSGFILMKIIHIPDQHIKEQINIFRESISLLGEGAPQVARRAASIPVSILVPALLSNFQGPSAVAIFSIVDKIRTITWQAINPVISIFAAKYFEKTATNDAHQNKFYRKVNLLLLLICFGMAVPAYIFAEYVLLALNVSLTSKNVFAWRIGCLGIFPSVLLAYLMAKYLPAIGRNFRFTSLIWIITGVVCISSFLIIPILGTPFAISQMIFWEVFVSIAILSNSRKSS